jgi:uncharacterized protein involved in type VI secretion and phage assembly
MPIPPVPKFSVKINGIPDPTLFGYITEIVVDTNVFMPGMFTITLQDKADIVGLLKFVDNVLMFRLGAPVEISALITNRKTQIPTKQTLIKGEITAIEPIFSDDGSVSFRIRGYDKAHRLTLGKKTRAFGGMPAPSVTDMQIVGQIASENGLIPKIDANSLLYNYVLQYNQSDWDFLWSRAQMLGYELYVDDMTLNFVEAGKSRNFTPTALKWGENLRRFEPRIVAAGAVTGVTVQGWDEGKQQTVKGSSSSFSGDTAATIPGALIPGSQAIKLAFMKTKAEDLIAEPTATSVSIANQVAAARMGEHESQFVRASGEAEGHPDILAGTNVAVTQVGVRFSGKYYVTEARHILRNGDYRVQFEVTGRSPYTIRHLLMGKESSSSNKIYGVVVGIVTNNNDLEAQGRVKVKFPWMSDELETGWVRVAMLGGGKEYGMFFAPEINDEVLVAFDQGDISSPYIVGSLWSGKNKPPAAPSGKAVVGGKVNQRIMRSRSGHVIVLDDTAGAEKILLQDKTGKNSLEIDSVKNAITIKSAGDLTIDVTGKLILKSKQDFTVESTTKADIKVGSAELTLEMAGSALKGTKLDLQGQTQTAIQGAQTSVKGSAMVEIQGGIVKIN